MLQLEDVVKMYLVGKVQERALCGVDLGCLDMPTSGRYVLDGTDVSSLSNNQLAKVRSRKIGFMSQSLNLVPNASVVRNVGLPLVYAGCELDANRPGCWSKLA